MKRWEQLKAVVEADGGLEILDQILVAAFIRDRSEFRLRAVKAAEASPELRAVALAYVTELKKAVGTP
jgi:hypothetical protein